MSKPEQLGGVEQQGPRFSLAELMETNLNNRDNGLGDRSLYFGASEILSCEEAMWHAKIRNVKKHRTLNELIVLLKGNIGESLVEWGLGEAIFEPQVEGEGSGEYDFIKSHADFSVLVNKNGEKIIIEVKTTGNVPESIRESWFCQVQVQMGTLKIKRAILFAMNLNTGDYEEFHISFNQMVFENTQKLIKEKWDRIHQPDYIPKGECGPLCASCPFKLECNTLKTDKNLPDEIAEMAKRLKEIKKEEKLLEENIRAFMKMASYNRAKSQKYDVIIDISPRHAYERTDFVKLRFEHPQVYKEVVYRTEKTTAMNIY